MWLSINWDEHVRCSLLHSKPFNSRVYVWNNNVNVIWFVNPCLWFSIWNFRRRRMSIEKVTIWGKSRLEIRSTICHTTDNLCQALDLIFFGALKKLKATALGEFDDQSVNAQRELVWERCKPVPFSKSSEFDGHWEPKPEYKFYCLGEKSFDESFHSSTSPESSLAKDKGR
jgi:hypothetical protein